MLIPFSIPAELNTDNNNNNGQLGGNVPTIGNVTAAQAHAQAQQLQNQALYKAQMAAQAQQQTAGAAAPRQQQQPPQQQAPQPRPSGQPIQVNPADQRQWNEFFAGKPDFRPLAFDQANPVSQKKLQEEYKNWRMQRLLLQHQQSNATARPPPQPTVTPAARLASTSAATTTSLQQQALESQNQALKKLSGQFAFISKPTTNEEKTFLPNNRLTSLAKKAYGDLAVGKLTPDAAAGMKLLAADFSKEAISYAITAARRKRANKLDPADVAVYLQQTWGIELPGFIITKTTEGGNGGAAGGVVAPYKRLSASDVHKARLAAVRRGNVAQTKLGVPGSGAGGSGPSGGAPVTSLPAAATTGGGGGVKGIRKGVQKKKITSKAAYAASLAAKEKSLAGGSASEGNGGDREESGDDEMEEDMPEIM